jgi:predicted DNA-binding transcriptional regulator AlpA
MHHHEPEPRYLTSDEAAFLLAVHPDTLGRWRRRGIGPRAMKTGPRVYRYPLAEINAFLAAGGQR